MPKYIIEATGTVSLQAIVEAKNKKEAKKLAEEEFGWEADTWEDLSVERISKDEEEYYVS